MSPAHNTFQVQQERKPQLILKIAIVVYSVVTMCVSHEEQKDLTFTTAWRKNA